MKSALCKHLEDLSGLAEAELKQVGLHPVQCLQWRVGVLAMGFEKGPAPSPEVYHTFLGEIWEVGTTR